MKKYTVEIKWALIFVVFALVWMVFEKWMGWHGEHIDKHATYTNIFAIPAIVIYVLAVAVGEFLLVDTWQPIGLVEREIIVSTPQAP